MRLQSNLQAKYGRTTFTTLFAISFGVFTDAINCDFYCFPRKQWYLNHKGSKHSVVIEN